MQPENEAIGTHEESVPSAAVATAAPEPEEGQTSAADPAPEVAPPASIDPSVEALLFVSEEPMPPQRLALVVGVRKGEVLEAIDRLNMFYAETGRAFRIASLAGGFQLVTTPEHGEMLGRLRKDKGATKLSRAALETLSIIAFKQPVTRAEIDAIRGVSASDGVVRHLLERRLVRIAGRAEAPGRPLLYGTTREFLAHFGLNAVADLPRTSELDALLAGEPRPAPVALEEEPAGIVESHSVEESDESGGFPPSQ